MFNDVITKNSIRLLMSITVSFEKIVKNRVIAAISIDALESQFLIQSLILSKVACKSCIGQMSIK